MKKVKFIKNCDYKYKAKKGDVANFSERYANELKEMGYVEFVNEKKNVFVEKK